MTENNPKIVLDAATSTQKELPVKLHPLTVSRYAWLEKLDSPFLVKDAQFKVSTVVPTIWALAASKEELKAAASEDIAALKERTLEWADECIGVDQLPAMIEAVSEMLFNLSKAAPRGGDQEKN